MGKRVKNKRMLLLLAVVMLVSSITACTGKSGNKGTKVSENNPTNEKGGTSGKEGNTGEQAMEPYKFSYLRPVWGAATYKKGGPYEKELFSKANVQIDTQIIPITEYDQKLNTIIASGVLPDVLWAGGPASKTNKDMQDQGAFLKINDYLEKYPAIKSIVSDTTWDSFKDEKGDIYFIPQPIYPIGPIFLFYRKDLFDTWGISEPSTIQEFETVLKTIKEKDPKMIPLTAQDDFWGLGALSTSFGFSHYSWNPLKSDPNTIVPYSISEENMNYQLWLKSLYQNGLLDSEFSIAKNWDHAKTKFMTEKAAILGISWGYIPEIYSGLKKTDPNAQIAIMKPLTGPNGEKGGVRPLGVNDRGFYVNAKIKDPDRFFEFLNWTLTDGTEFRKYGIEGKTFKKENGRNVLLPDAEREEDYNSAQIEPLQFVNLVAETFDWENTRTQYVGAGIEDQFEYVKSKYLEHAENAMYPDYRNYSIFSPTEVEKGAQLLADYLGSALSGIVINDKITKETWLDAIEKWKKAGGSKIIEEVNTLQKIKTKPQYDIIK